MIAAIETAITSWQEEPLEGYPAILADDLVFDHLTRWRLRNLVPDDHDIERLVAAWRNHRVPPSVPCTTLAPHHRVSFVEEVRLRLAYRSLADDASLSREAYKLSASPADINLIGGDHIAAAAAYQAEIRSGSASREAWAGLAVSRRRLLGEGGDAITMRPELICRLYDRLSADSKHAPPPLDVASWLTPICLDQQKTMAEEPMGFYLPLTLSAPRNRTPPGPE